MQLKLVGKWAANFFVQRNKTCKSNLQKKKKKKRNKNAVL